MSKTDPNIHIPTARLGRRVPSRGYIEHKELARGVPGDHGWRTMDTAPRDGTPVLLFYRIIVPGSVGQYGEREPIVDFIVEAAHWHAWLTKPGGQWQRASTKCGSLGHFGYTDHKQPPTFWQPAPPEPLPPPLTADELAQLQAFQRRFTEERRAYYRKMAEEA
jgi:hypothetical protein